MEVMAMVVVEVVMVVMMVVMVLAVVVVVMEMMVMVMAMLPFSPRKGCANMFLKSTVCDLYISWPTERSNYCDAPLDGVQFH